MTGNLLQAVKEPHAPETVSARDRICIAVLFELFRIDIFAGDQVAIGTDRVFVSQDLVPKRKERLIVPNILNICSGQISEFLGGNIFFAPGEMANKTVP